MKSIIVLVYMAIMALLVSGTALAQEPEQDVTEYRFTDENVVGDLVGINEVNITARPKEKERSLIKVRGHFITEMLKAVENI